jgi:hypothetical protein
MRRFAGPITYIELDAPHDLINPTLPDWPHLEHTLLDFIR